MNLFCSATGTAHPEETYSKLYLHPTVRYVPKFAAVVNSVSLDLTIALGCLTCHNFASLHLASGASCAVLKYYHLLQGFTIALSQYIGWQALHSIPAHSSHRYAAR